MAVLLQSLTFVDAVHGYLVRTLFICCTSSGVAVDYENIRRPHHEDEFTIRKLFGGAMECLLPAAYVNVRCAPKRITITMLGKKVKRRHTNLPVAPSRCELPCNFFLTVG